MRSFLLSALVLMVIGTQAFCEQPYTVRIHGRREVTITTATISLADLAEVSSPRLGDEETVIGLKRLFIEKAPAPGQSITISAAQLLARLREEGVDVQKVGYDLPRVMTAKRASRTLTKEEIHAAIELFLHDSGKETQLKSIRTPEEVHLLPGLVAIKAVAFEGGAPGKMNFSMSAEVEGQEPVRFNVDATIDEWREVPTIGRALPKGTRIAESDLVMARMNINQIPRDAVQRVADVVGLETAKDLNYGEIIRSSKLELPLAIQAGDRVTMIYNKGLLQASAKGVSLDSGALGQTVRVKNESSKRIVSGQIKEQGVVEVQP